MNSKIAKIINRACRKETQAFKNDLKRLWYKTPRPLRNKFKSDLIETCNATEAEINAEQSA